MTTAYIGLGSNLDSPCQHIVAAFSALDALPATALTRRSALYKSKPVGPPDQADFINAVAELRTGLLPLALLDGLRAIEDRHGRARGRRWGPRTLDLDLLLYGAATIKHERLTVPHPEMLKRAFVLAPLVEIRADCRLPGGGAPSDHLAALDRAGLERLP